MKCGKNRRQQIEDKKILTRIRNETEVSDVKVVYSFIDFTIPKRSAKYR